MSPESPVTEHRKKMRLHNMCIRKQLCFFNNSLEVKCRLPAKMEPLGATDAEFPPTLDSSLGTPVGDMRRTEAGPEAGEHLSLKGARRLQTDGERSLAPLPLRNKSLKLSVGGQLSLSPPEQE